MRFSSFTTRIPSNDDLEYGADQRVMKLERGFVMLAVGDVLAGADQSLELTIGRKARRGHRLYPAPLAIGTPAALFGLKRRMLVQRALKGLENAGASSG